MSFLKNLFGKGKPAPKADPRDGELITVYDELGRKIQITRQQWRENVLKGNLEKAFNDPDALYQLIVSALQDEFYDDVVEPAEQLQKIDPIPHRAATILSIAYLKTGRVQDAEKVLLACISRHGEDGVLLTNLAKVYSAQNRKEEELKTLWHALELDPNQDNAVGWYEAIHRENEGAEGGFRALQRIAALPGSWRAQLWLARHALQERNLPEALGLYRQCLEISSSPSPHDLLMQISGDLGKAGHLPELLELVAPHYDSSVHGLQVGNNLIKAFLDTGQIEPARKLIHELQLQQRPDWQETLGFWGGELAKVRCETTNTKEAKPLSASLLALEGPSIQKTDSPTGELFSSKSEDAPRVCFLGSTAETANASDRMESQPSDNPGRFSRAIPLILSEYFYTQSNANTCVLVPWISDPEGGGFILTGQAWQDDAASPHARNMDHPYDFLVTSHLIARGENWTLQTRIIRTIDAKCLHQHEYKLAEWQPHTITDRLFADTHKILEQEAGVVEAPQPTLSILQGIEMDHYLFRLEQCLAVQCSAITEQSNFLSNTNEIVDGIIQLCAQSPSSVNCRLLLVRTLAALKVTQPDLVPTFGKKITYLQTKHPLPEPAHALVEQELKKLLD